MPPRRPLSPANQGGTEAGPSSKKRREATGSKSNTGPVQKKTPSSAKSSSKSGSSGAADNSNKQAMQGNSKQRRLDKGKGKARATDSDDDSVESEGNEGTDDESAAEARGEENLSSSYRLDVRLTSGSRHSLAYNPSTTMPQSNRRRLTLNESRRRSPR